MIDNTDNKAYRSWVDGLNMEGKVMYDLMTSFVDDYSPIGDDGSDVELLTTNEIIDRMFDMGKLDMTFVNVFLRFAGYKTTKVNGKVLWRLYRRD